MRYVADAMVEALAAVCFENRRVSENFLKQGDISDSHGGIGCAASPTSVILPP